MSVNQSKTSSPLKSNEDIEDNIRLVHPFLLLHAANSGSTLSMTTLRYSESLLPYRGKVCVVGIVLSSWTSCLYSIRQSGPNIPWHTLFSFIREYLRMVMDSVNHEFVAIPSQDLCTRPSTVSLPSSKFSKRPVFPNQIIFRDSFP